MTTQQLEKLPKWAQEEWKQQAKDLALSRSFCWPTSPEPKPVHTDALLGDAWRKLYVGWHVHTNGEHYEVRQGCCSRVYHNTHGIYKTTTQGTGTFYQSKMDALIVARWQLCRRFAESLARLDEEMKASLNAPCAYITDEKKSL